jgi:hypothetical protein
MALRWLLCDAFWYHILRSSSAEFLVNTVSKILSDIRSIHESDSVCYLVSSTIGHGTIGASLKFS